MDIALQGPKSKEILLTLKSDASTKEELEGLKRYWLMRGVLGGFDLIISRTGYTGEDQSYELFVHPDKAPDLWETLLTAGEGFDLRPCGLAARDSLRIEAGLPLYGQELAGPFGLTPGDAGFRTFVKTYKPWFIGRDEFIKQDEQRRREIVRFRFPEKGTRPAHLGDIVADKDGNTIGNVTSCSIDRFGTLTGQAHVDRKYKKVGSEIYIHQGTAGKEAAKTNADASLALVLTRFPK